MSFLLTLFLLAQPGLCETPAADLDFYNIAAGEAAPYEGKLLTNEALAEIFTQHQLEIDILKAQHAAATEKQKLSETFRYDMLDTRYKLEVDMYSSMILNRDVLIKKYDPQQSYRRSDWKFVGGFLSGALITVGVSYSLDKKSH